MENDENVAQSRPGSHWNPRVAGVASEALFVSQGWAAFGMVPHCARKVQSYDVSPNLSWVHGGRCSFTGIALSKWLACRLLTSLVVVFRSVLVKLT